MSSQDDQVAIVNHQLHVKILYAVFICSTFWLRLYRYICTEVPNYVADQVMNLLKEGGNVCLFVFVALRPMSTAMVIAGRSVHLTTLFPGQA